MFDLDSQIDAEHKKIEQAEHEALAVIERLGRIPAAQPWLREALKKRQYGQTPSPWAAGGNLTAQAAVIGADRPFAAWLAGKSGHRLPPPDYKGQQAEQQQLASAERLAEATARLRQQNQATRDRWAARSSWKKPAGTVWL